MLSLRSFRRGTDEVFDLSSDPKTLFLRFGPVHSIRIHGVEALLNRRISAAKLTYQARPTSLERLAPGSGWIFVQRSFDIDKELRPL
jgi:hypothetical protein